ncbi:uncharacterized protein LY89DRAFT_729350 [Mollisia scopiformis]|uniref:SNF2 N-terminal domain-containing protein n=1 Tax=Mollisia scopiformis TaxID=149040 RepID=A0A194XNM2_MOLSC|nr:uncharacterized protein LY89DRAFT_729350 [Mollisia scopiformis]KUJ21850.1 hypothetical protein LY89DRAFT_729350 [Mollisia scopiformis]
MASVEPLPPAEWYKDVAILKLISGGNAIKISQGLGIPLALYDHFRMQFTHYSEDNGLLSMPNTQTFSASYDLSRASPDFLKSLWRAMLNDAKKANNPYRRLPSQPPPTTTNTPAASPLDLRPSKFPHNLLPGTNRNDLENILARQAPYDTWRRDFLAVVSPSFDEAKHEIVSYNIYDQTVCCIDGPSPFESVLSRAQSYRQAYIPFVVRLKGTNDGEAFFAREDHRPQRPPPPSPSATFRLTTYVKSYLRRGSAILALPFRPALERLGQTDLSNEAGAEPSPNSPASGLDRSSSQPQNTVAPGLSNGGTLLATPTSSLDPSAATEAALASASSSGDNPLAAGSRHPSPSPTTSSDGTLPLESSLTSGPGEEDRVPDSRGRKRPVVCVPDDVESDDLYSATPRPKKRLQSSPPEHDGVTGDISDTNDEEEPAEDILAKEAVPPELEDEDDLRVEMLQNLEDLVTRRCENMTHSVYKATCQLYTGANKFTNVQASPRQKIPLPGTKGNHAWLQQLLCSFWLLVRFRVCGGAFCCDDPGVGKTRVFILVYLTHLFARICESSVRLFEAGKSGCEHLPPDAPPGSVCPSQDQFPVQCICVPGSLTRYFLGNLGPALMFCHNDEGIQTWEKQFDEFIDVDSAFWKKWNVKPELFIQVSKKTHGSRRCPDSSKPQLWANWGGPGPTYPNPKSTAKLVLTMPQSFFKNVVQEFGRPATPAEKALWAEKMAKRDPARHGFLKHIPVPKEWPDPKKRLENYHPRVFWSLVGRDEFHLDYTMATAQMRALR